MKKGLMILAVTLFVTSLYSAVDLRMRKVSYIEAPPGTNTLVVAIEARSNSTKQRIYNFQGAFYMGANLDALNPVITYDDDDFFSSTNHYWNKEIDELNGVVYFKWENNDELDGSFDAALLKNFLLLISGIIY